MSFEMKYDKNRMPILPSNDAQLRDVKAAAPIQQVKEQPILAPQLQENVYHDNDADATLAETLQTTSIENNIPAQDTAGETEEAVQAAPQNNQNEPTQERGPKESFRELRAKAERAERERDEAVKYIKQLQESQQPQKQQQPSVDDDIDFNLDPNDYVEPKHLNKFKNKIKNLEQQLQNQQQQAALMTTETRLKSQYPDFDKVVSKDNIEALRYAYPEIAETLNSSTDLYSKAVSAYTLIKKFGIAQEINSNYDQDRELVKKNATKPRPLVSASPQQGTSPMAMANAFQNGLTDDVKRQLYKEMIEAKKLY